MVARDQVKTSTSESQTVANDQVKTSTQEVQTVMNAPYFTSEVPTVADDQVKTSTQEVPTVLQNSCPSERDHLVLFSGFNSNVLVEVNYIISYRGAIGIDDTLEGTFGQVGNVYVHSYATFPKVMVQITLGTRSIDQSR